ncbi:hypothetical protein JCM11251_001503 [Rhodosporidiobolus azoricus]
MLRLAHPRRLVKSLSTARTLLPFVSGSATPLPPRTSFHHVPASLPKAIRLSSTTAPPEGLPRAEHAVISAFDLFSIGVGPSSSHTVGPMRAGRIFVEDLHELGILEKVRKIKIGLYGSLAATGKGHMTPEAVMMGLEGSDPETIETSTIASRYSSILTTFRLTLGGTQSIAYSHQNDMIWSMNPLPAHPNGLRFSVFDEEGTLLATNEYFSVGGGFVVNEKTQVDENLYYRGISKSTVDHSRLDQTHGLSPSELGGDSASPSSVSLPSPSSSSDALPLVQVNGQDTSVISSPIRGKSPHPPFLFRDAAGLLKMTQKHNLTIAQLVWENERHRLTDDEISSELMKLWSVMDASIHAGVSSTEELLPGRLKVRRRAPALYRRLYKGFYPSLSPSGAPSLPSPTSHSRLRLPSSTDPSSPLSPLPPPPLSSPFPSSAASGPPLTTGSFTHPLPPSPRLRTTFPGIDFLSLYAIAVNETNASGGRVVTAPTNGAAGVIPAVLKYLVEFVSDEAQGTVQTFLLTAAAIGMLYKRGATISAAEGGCMAEVGVASSMAAGAYTACLGGTPAQILQAAEIGIEHHLGLTCDPPDGLVIIPCIERNSLGAVKAVTAAQLALAGDGQHAVSLDDAIEAMRVTARDMSTAYKETSLSGLATSIRIPVSSPAC